MRTEYVWKGIDGSPSRQPLRWECETGDLMVQHLDSTSRPWKAWVGTSCLISRAGLPRKFKTADAAKRAAMLGHAHGLEDRKDHIPF